MLKAAGVTPVAISTDSITDSQDLAARLQLSFALLSDPDLVAASAYGVAMVGRDIAVPATFVIEADRTISYRYVGEDMTDRPRLDAVLARPPAR
jgi:peroxiredoxin